MEKYWEHISFDNAIQKDTVTQIYKELKFVKLVEDLQVHQIKELSIVYITGIVQEKEVFLPISRHETITMNQLTTLQNTLLSSHSCTRLTLAMMDADSTSVYFCITPGLLPPTEVPNRDHECANTQETNT